MGATATKAGKRSTVAIPDTEAVRKLGVLSAHSGRSIGSIVLDWIEVRLEDEYAAAVRQMTAEGKTKKK